MLFLERELDRYSKKPAAHVLNAIAKHTPDLAQAVIDAGAVKQLALCLEEFDPLVKEIGASALGNIARHNAKLAGVVVDSCAIPLLVLCVQVCVSNSHDHHVKSLEAIKGVGKACSPLMNLEWKTQWSTLHGCHHEGCYL